MLHGKDKKEFDSTVNDRLFEFLNEKNITITEAAKATGLTRETFYNIRDYKSLPSADTLLKMSVAYYLIGFSIEYTITGKMFNFRESQLQKLVDELTNELKKRDLVIAQKEEMIIRKDQTIENLSSALGTR